MLTYAILTPYPPAIIPEIGGASAKKFEKTIGALFELGVELRRHQPDTIIFVSAAGEVRLDRFTICVPHSPDFSVSLSELGAKSQPRTFPRDRILTAQIIESAAGNGIGIEPVLSDTLDYGVAVPLHYLASGLPQVSLVSLSLSLTSLTSHERLGQLIRELADESDKRVALVVSSELAHRISKESPFGFHPRAKAFDAAVVVALEKRSTQELALLDSLEADEVGGQQYRGVALLLGALGSEEFTGGVQSYEAPGGIGCAVAAFTRR
jgi:aromatic ring-opening dioxygenase LigB subunit